MINELGAFVSSLALYITKLFLKKLIVICTKQLALKDQQNNIEFRKLLWKIVSRISIPFKSNLIIRFFHKISYFIKGLV